jgi:hypothetical protein
MPRPGLLDPTEVGVQKHDNAIESSHLGHAEVDKVEIQDTCPELWAGFHEAEEYSH